VEGSQEEIKAWSAAAGPHVSIAGAGEQLVIIIGIHQGRQRRLLLHMISRAASLARFRAGSRMVSRIAIMAITTSNSIKVNFDRVTLAFALRYSALAAPLAGFATRSLMSVKNAFL